MKIDFSRLSDAEKLLWSFGVLEPDHIDLDAIAHEVGAAVEYEPLEGCEARIMMVGQKAIITVRPSTNLGRQRFSLGHELAHWINDKGVPAFLCAGADLSPQNEDAQSVEASANAYASQLLLPNYLVDPYLEGRLTTLAEAGNLQRLFRTSLTAAAIKLVRRSSHMACLVCHDQTERKWSIQSKTFPDEFRPVRQLHQETHAFTETFKSKGGMTVPQALPADRWVSGRYADRRTVIAQSLRVDEGVVLTLFTLNS